MTAVRICVATPYRDDYEQVAELPRGVVGRGVTLHSGRNLIQRLSITRAGGDSMEVVVKAFAVPVAMRGFVYAHLRQSKARRCLLNAKRLAELGVGTPDPIACIEYESFGCLRQSYYVSRYWHADQDLTGLLYRGVSTGPDTPVLLEHLAQFTAAQHDRGVLHLDYNPGNILVRTRDGRFDFALVDLNRLRFGRLDMNDRITGLVRLTTIVDYMRTIGRHYARLCGTDPDAFCRRLEEAQHRFATTRRRIKSALALLK